ncbi:uncharacterized protein At1g66480-like [Cucurbita pepo subsp. pepo]|uniref:uncharacterized protein At1g66480-like n=1 Tax=Cucurbita pepo subsp. pepo TaxID=3664 RepID=UPI000C9D4A62|nr:uncharacterized protein At1g66480-like [Cucurbita pepo subsp. pepo]
MGNAFGGKKTVKVMKVTGETMKLNTPVQAGDVVKDYPGFVVLDSEAVKHYGVRAKPLEPHQNLSRKRLYFLVDLPKLPNQPPPRRIRSAIHMSAKDRLESLMLARRSASDLTIMKPKSVLPEEDAGEGSSGAGTTRLKVRLPRAEVEKLLKESKDKGEAAEKIVGLYGLYMDKTTQSASKNAPKEEKEDGIKPREKRRVSFMTTMEAGTEIAVAS